MLAEEIGEAKRLEQKVAKSAKGKREFGLTGKIGFALFDLCGLLFRSER